MSLLVMNSPTKIGMGFGITSGVITTLGLMIGLYESTDSKLAIIGGIITIAVADAFSDSLGIHVSEESVERSQRKVWKSTFFTFVSKFFTALVFLVPFLFFKLGNAIIVDVILGFLILGVFSYLIAKSQKERPLEVVLEHLLITAGVVIVTYFIGKGIGILFG